MVKEIVWKLSLKQKSEINAKDSLLFVEGSAGAGKTIYAAHKTIKYGLEHTNARLGVFRETFPALKATALLETRELLDGYGIPYKENKNDKTITLPTGSVILFRSLDDLKKIRSLNLDYIWVEQAEEIGYETFQELKRRLRGNVGKDSYLQMILTLTPETPDHWIYEYAHRKGKGRVIHFHYTENPFLPVEYVLDLESLKEEDYELWVKYAEGKWGKLTNIIYNNWDEKTLDRQPTYWYGGADFGYNDPSVFLLIGYYDGELYIVDEVYRRHLTNTEFISKCDEMLIEQTRFQRGGMAPHLLEQSYGDAAEPDRIKEFSQRGYKMLPGSKQVLDRIDRTKTTRIHINPKCIETLKEIKSYKFKKDKDGNILDEPIKKFNHAMNSLEHVAAALFKSRRVGSAYATSKKKFEFAE